MTFWAVGASLVGGLIQSGNASDAASAQQGASAAQIAEARRQFDLTRGDYATGRNVGNNALLALAQYSGLPPGVNSSGGGGGAYSGMSEADIRAMLTPQFTTAATPSGWGFTGTGSRDGGQDLGVTPGTPASVNQAGLDAAVSARLAQQPQASTGPASTGPAQSNIGSVSDALDPTKDPGYQFGLQQGQLALDRKAAAAGGRVSGASLKDATQYATDYATTGYNAAYQRRQDRLNRLQALAGIGQTATAGSAAAGAQATNAITTALGNRGDNLGAASLYQGNIWGNAANQLGAIAMRNYGGNPANPASPNYPIGGGTGNVNTMGFGGVY